MALPSLYVHVPFCVVKCGYCDFNSYVVDDAAVMDRFVSALDRELAFAAPPRVPPTVFVGGGTPTYLDAPRFETFLATLRRHVDLDLVTEVSIEANPESLDRTKAKLAFDAGFRRASVGAQSFDAERLRFLDRAHDGAAVGRAVADLRAAGFENVSLDLMFGMPGQTVDAWESDLEAALALEPDHLSCYHLSFEPGTRLTRDHRLGRVAANDEDEDRQMFLRTRELLRERGFVAYEVSNFAGRGGPCRHNDLYWLQGDYIGVGPGASSHRDGWRATNLKAVEAWAHAVERGLPPTGEAESLSRRQRAAEAVWLGVRRTEGVDLAAVAARLGVDPRTEFPAALGRVTAAGLAAVFGATLVLTEDGLPFGDAVGSAFLEDV
ncbi:MAG: radical SAM family heme chaperone HemW [Planctomycetota bacterium]